MVLLQSEAMVVKKLLVDEKLMASVKQICLLSVICKVTNIVWWKTLLSWKTFAINIWTKRYFHINFSSKISILLTPNMAALSRGCKPRIHGWLKLKYCYQMQYGYSHFLIRYFSEFRKLKVYNKIYVVYREYFMESAGWRTVFTHELLTYQKSKEWAQRMSKISDTKTTSA